MSEASYIGISQIGRDEFKKRFFPHMDPSSESLCRDVWSDVSDGGITIPDKSGVAFLWPVNADGCRNSDLHTITMAWGPNRAITSKEGLLRFVASQFEGGVMFEVFCCT